LPNRREKELNRTNDKERVQEQGVSLRKRDNGAGAKVRKVGNLKRRREGFSYWESSLESEDRVARKKLSSSIPMDLGGKESLPSPFGS